MTRIVHHACGVIETQKANGQPVGYALSPAMVAALKDLRDRGDPDLDGILAAHQVDHDWLNRQP